MEGSTGVVSAEQVTYGDPGYEFGRRMQLHDTMAAVSAALDWEPSPLQLTTPMTG